MRCARPILDRGGLSFSLLLGLFSLLPAWASPACAGPRAPSQLSAQKQDAPIESREALLLWLDEYLSSPVLIRPEDVKKLRENIAKMSSADVEKLIAETAELRKLVESDEWQKTKDWLRQFLQVQAIYSDQEIEDLRNRIPRMSADELIDLMKKIREKHNTLRWMHASSERNRAASLQAVETAQRQQEAARRAAQRGSANRPLYGGGTSSPGQRRDRGYRPPPPLITSREVAREAVYRSVFPYSRGW